MRESNLSERLEPGIAVDLQDAAEPFQVSRRALRLAIRAVEIDGRRRIRPSPGAVVARIDPEPPGLGPTSAGIEHGNGRIVGEQLGRREDMGGKPRLQRLQPPAGATDPARQGRAFDRCAMPGEDLSLPVKRGVVAVPC